MLELGGKSFRAVTIQGESPETIVIGGEYGNGNCLHSYVRAMGIRAVLGPHSSLVLLPNNTLGHDNLNFTADDRTQLAQGNPTPYIDRYKKAIKSVDTRDDSPVDIVGVSLGASTGLAFAADCNTPTRTVTVVETPFLHSVPAPLAELRFARGNTQMNDNLTISEQAIPDFDANKLDTRLKPTVEFYTGLLTPSNFAGLRFMQHHLPQTDIDTLLEVHSGIGFVSAWGTEAQISPATTNRAIAEKYIHDSRTEYVEIPGADHSVTNAHAVVAALALHAKSLSAQ